MDLEIASNPLWDLSLVPVPDVSSECVVELVDDFWGDKLSEYAINPAAREKIRVKYVRRINSWKKYGTRKEAEKSDINKIRIVPLKGGVDKYGWRLTYRVYYGNGMYDEWGNNSRTCAPINPDTTPWADPEERNCCFCLLPADHSSCGCDSGKDRIDQLINYLK